MINLHCTETIANPFNIIVLLCYPNDIIKTDNMNNHKVFLTFHSISGNMKTHYYVCAVSFRFHELDVTPTITKTTVRQLLKVDAKPRVTACRCKDSLRPPNPNKTRVFRYTPSLKKRTCCSIQLTMQNTSVITVHAYRRTFEIETPAPAHPAGTMARI